jgi:broad specificity phosphatase PhoE
MEIKKTVYFIRHGESEANISPVYQGPSSPLSQTGLDQAERVAVRVSKLDFEALISSPLSRTKQTSAEITKLTNKIPEYSELFVERIKPSKLFDMPHDAPGLKELSREWKKSIFDPSMRVEDGENYSDLINRSDKALEFLQKRDETNIVVVTHGYFLRTIIARVLLGDTISGENFKNFQSSIVMQNTGISVLQYSKFKDEKDFKWRLWVYNDHSHLG